MVTLSEFDLSEPLDALRAGGDVDLTRSSVEMVLQALRDIKGRAEDRDAFIAALSKVQFKGPMGMASFDEHHGLVADFYPLAVERGKDGQLQNRCGERIAQVKDPYELFP